MNWRTTLAASALLAFSAGCTRDGGGKTGTEDDSVCEATGSTDLAAISESEWPDGLADTLVAYEAMDGRSYAVEVTCDDEEIVAGGSGVLSFSSVCDRDEMSIVTYEGPACEGERAAEVIECTDTTIATDGWFATVGAWNTNAMSAIVGFTGTWQVYSGHADAQDPTMNILGLVDGTLRANFDVPGDWGNEPASCQVSTWTPEQ